MGLIIFDDPKDWDSYDIIIEAEWNSPDPSETNSFIKTQMREESKTKILQILK